MIVVLSSLDAGWQLRTRIADRDLQPGRAGGQEDLEVTVRSTAPVDDCIAGQFGHDHLGVINDNLRVAPLEQLATDSCAEGGDGVPQGGEALLPGERIGGFGRLAGRRAHSALL